MAVKKHRCKTCNEYKQDTIKLPIGRFCDTSCAALFAKKMLDNKKERAKKEERKKHAKRKRAFYDNDKSIRTKAAQRAFNQYIRERDRGAPCISCGRSHGGQYHAGHYKSVGACPSLRFEERNCHKQCSVCNNHRSGNIAEYRINLIKKIGLEQVEWLEGQHEPKHYTCQELKEIELYYKAKLKELRDESKSTGSKRNSKSNTSTDG